MPPGSRIYYKFKSTAKFKTIDLVDHWISVAELKPLIAQKEGLSADDSTELLLSDPRTGEEFRDATKQVAQNSSIVVRRVPVIRHEALQAKLAATVPGLALPGLGPLVQGGASPAPEEDTDDDAFGGAVYADQPGNDGAAANPINDIMQRMVKQQAESHRLQVMDQRAGRGAALARGRGRVGVAVGGRGAFPLRDLSEFTCSRCGVKGDHFEKDCPVPDKLVKRIRHASGVPNGALAPSAEGGLLLPSGQYGAIVPNTAGFQAAVAPLLSLTASPAPGLPPASQVPAAVSAPTGNQATAIAAVQSGSGGNRQSAPPLALPHQPSNKPSALLAASTAGSTPQFAGDDLLEVGSSIFSSAAAAPTVGLPSLGPPMTPAEFLFKQQQQLGLKLQQKTKAEPSRSDGRNRRSNSRSRNRSRRSRSRSRSRRRYSRSSSRSRSRSRDHSRDRHRRGSRRSYTHSRSRSPSLRRGRSRSSRSPGRHRGRPAADGSGQYPPAQFAGHAAVPIAAQLLQLEDAPVRQQVSADAGPQPTRQHRLANSSRKSPPAASASREQSSPTRHKGQPAALRQRSPVPRRPGMNQRASPFRPDLDPATYNTGRWSHDGEASDAAAAIARKERLVEEAKRQQAAKEQADAEAAERARQAERALVEAAAEQQRLAGQRRMFEKAEKQQQAEEKRAAKYAVQEAEQQRVAADERRLALERKQAEAARVLGRKPSLKDRLSLGPNLSSRQKVKRLRSPSISRSRSFSSTDSRSCSSSRSPSVDRRGKRGRTAGHRKHGGRLRSKSISLPRDTASAALPRSRSRRIERLQVLGGDLPSRFTVALEDGPSKRSKEGKAKKESKHRHRKNHSSKASKSSKRKHEHKRLRKSLEARLSPARHSRTASPLPPQASPECAVSQAQPPPAADPAPKELPGQAKLQRIKANRPLFALALGDTKRKKTKKFGS